MKDVKERPILFNTRMVEAILSGRKTQTRRTVNRLAGFGQVTEFGKSETQDYDWAFRNKRKMWNDLSHAELIKLHPLGKVGDQLWVRETWALYQTVDYVRRPSGASFSEVSDGMVGYKADGFWGIEDFREHIQLMSEGCSLEHVLIDGDRWKPSIHMPRWASRLTLEIIDVRIERLNDISTEDAEAEGFTKTYLSEMAISCDMDWHFGPKHEYEHLWRRIYGHDSWEQNPWVWVIEFKRI